MARWENIGIFPTEGFEVADFEMRAWEVFEGPTVIVSSKRLLTEAQSRDEKRKKLDVLLKCDFSNDPIKFNARQLLVFADVFYRRRECRDIASEAASGNLDALKNYRERRKCELLEHASLIQIAASAESLTPAGARFRLRERVSPDAERAELVCEVRRLDGHLRSLEMQIAALARKINCLEWESRSLKSIQSLEEKIDELVIKHKLAKTDVLNAVERDALSGAYFRKNAEEGRKERRRLNRKQKNEAIGIFRQLKKQAKKNGTAQSTRQLIELTRQEIGKRKGLTAEGIDDSKEVPKENAFYVWLRGRHAL